MCGLTVNIRNPASPAPETARKTVARLPERRKDMTRKVVKNINAVPKSPMMASAPTQTAENAMKRKRFLPIKSLSSVAVPA
jgi:hypothetical protein